MAARAAGFALTWPTFTTLIRGTDLAGSGRPRTWRTAGRRRTIEAALTASEIIGEAHLALAGKPLHFHA
jgi:hypothetical protein